jgi:hypothetical protein
MPAGMLEPKVGGPIMRYTDKVICCCCTAMLSIHELGLILSMALKTNSKWYLSIYTVTASRMLSPLLCPSMRWWKICTPLDVVRDVRRQLRDSDLWILPRTPHSPHLGHHQGEFVAAAKRHLQRRPSVI